MIHTPVLVDEVLELFAPKPGDRLLDATLGTGGHTKAYLTAAGNTSTVVGLDADPKALEQARTQLAGFSDRVTYINKNFAALNDAINGGGIVKPSEFTHILFDLGIGTHQLADQDRAFSFSSEATLDMRFGEVPTNIPATVEAVNMLTRRLGYAPNAAEFLRNLSANELAEIIHTYGEERHARRIAAALKQADTFKANEVADIISQALPGGRSKIHPATRTFQALRLAVNRELEALAAVIPTTANLLAPGGITAIISFHSLEDRIVKTAFRELAKTSHFEVLTKKPIIASGEETKKNPRSRSAKLRAIK